MLQDGANSQKSGGTIFQGCSVILVGSGGAVRAWKILDFEFPKHFNIAIQANKML